jgi:hypothetical protein
MTRQGSIALAAGGPSPHVKAAIAEDSKREGRTGEGIAETFRTVRQWDLKKMDMAGRTYPRTGVPGLLLTSGSRSLHLKEKRREKKRGKRIDA